MICPTSLVGWWVFGLESLLVGGFGAGLRQVAERTARTIPFLAFMSRAKKSCFHDTSSSPSQIFSCIYMTLVQFWSRRSIGYAE